MQLLLVSDYNLVFGPQWPLPQQLPGPRHSAWCGCDPQQPVSPAPGSLLEGAPDKEECADTSFVNLGLPQ